VFYFYTKVKSRVLKSATPIWPGNGFNHLRLAGLRGAGLPLWPLRMVWPPPKGQRKKKSVLEGWPLGVGLSTPRPNQGGRVTPCLAIRGGLSHPLAKMGVADHPIAIFQVLIFFFKCLGNLFIFIFIFCILRGIESIGINSDTWACRMVL
jgi:hypothetical protein